MASQRWKTPPRLTCSSRVSVDPSHYASIDSILKDMKVCSRRLQLTFSTYLDELHILERLYYKGKNQHRSALFWKKTIEMKRYGERLVNMALPDNCELLRCSFFGATSIQHPRGMRGSWTHVPNVDYVAFTIERFSACFVLVEKFHECLIETHQSLKLAMQTGAFIQLILTLVAVTSRMDALVPELRDSLGLTSRASHRILQLLDPRRAKQVSPIPVEDDIISVRVSIGQETNPVSNEIPLNEDMGDVIVRPADSKIAPLLSHAVDITSTKPYAVGEDAILMSNSVLDLTEIGKALGSQTNPNHNDKAERATEGSKMPIETVQKRRKNDDAVPHRKKKKKKKDEIDDIFGF